MTYQESLNQLRELLNDCLTRKPAPLIKRSFTRETRGGGREQFYEMTCNGCGTEFEAKRSDAIWCDNSCTTRTSRSKVQLKKMMQDLSKSWEKEKA